jgi:hypothetical protein
MTSSEGSDNDQTPTKKQELSIQDSPQHQPKNSVEEILKKLLEGQSSLVKGQEKIIKAMGDLKEHLIRVEAVTSMTTHNSF